MASRNGQLQKVQAAGLSLPGFVATKTALLPDGEPTFEQWVEAGRVLTHCESALNWWIGDWLNYGENKYDGEKYARALDELQEATGYERQTLQQAKWVSSRVQSCTRVQDYPWTCHRLVAPLEPEEQEEFLQLGHASGLSRTALRDAIRDRKKGERIEELLDGLDDDDFRPDVAVRPMEEILAQARGLDAIITDPPYPEEFLPLYGRMAELAKDALRPGGILAAMCGQSYLPQIVAAMSAHLPYRWTLAYLTPGGQAVQLWERKVNTFWKPVLLFGGSEEWLGDVVKSDVNDNDKRFHGWGQSESGMLNLVERLTLPGQLVCDPFLGAGTTGVACVATGRRFVGGDVDPDAVKAAAARISAAHQQRLNSTEEEG